MAFDIVLKGGHVIDPKNGIDAALDVALSDGKVAAVAADLPTEDVERCIDVSGLYVVPGLVDIHMHAYATLRQRTRHEGQVHEELVQVRAGQRRPERLLALRVLLAAGAVNQQQQQRRRRRRQRR